MKIVVASESPFKVRAVERALEKLGIEAEVVGVNAVREVTDEAQIIGVKAKSNVAEQPMQKETLEGAKNRLAHAQELAKQAGHHDADLYIAIENGLFKHMFTGSYMDQAVVLAVGRDGEPKHEWSKKVKFPTKAVEEARRRGFQNTTAGQVMQEWGMVKDHRDPHSDLGDKTSREDILTEAVTKLLKDKLKWAGKASAPKDYARNVWPGVEP